MCVSVVSENTMIFHNPPLHKHTHTHTCTHTCTHSFRITIGVRYVLIAAVPLR